MKVSVNECHDHVTDERIAHLRSGTMFIRVCERSGGVPASTLVLVDGRRLPLSIDGDPPYDLAVAHWKRLLEQIGTPISTVNVTATVQPKAA